MARSESRRFDEQLAASSRILLDATERVEALAALRAQEAPDAGGERAPRVPQVSRNSEDALLFNLERAAWALIEMASAWVYELRLGIPRKETESLDLLQRHGLLDLETARRYKQLCEFRNLSARESDRIDWSYLGGGLAEDLRLFRQWNDQAMSWPREKGPAR